MSAHAIVERLEYCRSSGDREWIARCPAHDDRSPSLSVRDVGDDRTLIHCHAGCAALAVLDALGLDWGALYPPQDRHRYKSTKQQRERSLDELVVEIAIADMNAGRELSALDRERAREALYRLDGRS